ncbi:MAG: Gmad2 immunoglobulin-like domain-containing protein [bacterium]|nr:Gmad2 immunoglobulin-like domain-containing protein [bacterium]
MTYKWLGVGLVAILIVVGFGVAWRFTKPATTSKAPVLVVNFAECVNAGNPVLEVYPRQCRNGDQSFVEDIGNELEKTDLIRVDTPRPNAIVSSPFTIRGEARGSWFFEATFPVELIDSDGLTIAQGIATAKKDWMTSEFVPFEATLTFAVNKNKDSSKGVLILRKDNPSGLAEHDDALEVPVTFAGYIGSTPPVEGGTTEYTCLSEQRAGDMCAQIYSPVCATIEVQCIKAPCDPIKQTFSNVCEACHSSLVHTYSLGECKRGIIKR